MPPSKDTQGAPHSIGELSRLTGVHIETIRYYERVKILPTPPRTEGGRRAYGQSHRRTLGFIRRARDLGFSLDEIRALLTPQQTEADTTMSGCGIMSSSRTRIMSTGVSTRRSE